MYSDLYLNQRDRSVPRGALVLLLAMMGGFFTFLYTQRPPDTTQASTSRLVEQRVVALTDTSAGLILTLSEPAHIVVLYGPDAEHLTQAATDERTPPGTSVKRLHHSVRLESLEPQQTYSYKLIADDEVLQTMSGRTTDEITTLPLTTSATQSTRPIYGKVVAKDGSGVPDALVIVGYDPHDPSRSQVTSTRATGEWLMNLAWPTQDADLLTLQVRVDGSRDSIVKVLAAQASPLPQSIIVGSDYTFVDAPQVLPARTVAAEERDHVVQLLYPEPQSIIPVGRPLIKGRGVPGTPVTVLIDSRPVLKIDALVAKDGTWVADSPADLAPGRYTLRASVRDNAGSERVFERVFVMAKAGEQVLGESDIATASGTLTPTKTRTPTPLITVSQITPIITMSISITPPITQIITPSTVSVDGQQPGSSDSYILLLVAGILLVVGFGSVRLAGQIE